MTGKIKAAKKKEKRKKEIGRMTKILISWKNMATIELWMCESLHFYAYLLNRKMFQTLLFLNHKVNFNLKGFWSYDPYIIIKALKALQVVATEKCMESGKKDSHFTFLFIIDIRITIITVSYNPQYPLLTACLCCLHSKADI